MKVQYLIDYPDPSVSPQWVFKAGWTAEHDDPTALKRIALGVCKEVAADVRPTKSALILTQCVPDGLSDSEQASILPSKSAMESLLAKQSRFKHK